MTAPSRQVTPPITRTIVSLAGAVTIWSLSPLLIVRARGLATPPALALMAVAIAAIALVGATSFSKTYRIDRNWAAVRDAGATRDVCIVGLLAFLAYPILYFSALQRGSNPGLVNLVNYLWPIIGLGVLLFKQPHRRSLETCLAAVFGFSGASIAILSGTSNAVGNGTAAFVLAALGALAYGIASAVQGLADRPPVLHLQVLMLSLALAGFLAATLLITANFIGSGGIDIEAGPGRIAALLAYALLLPVAHFSFMMSVTDDRVDAYVPVFLVPVGATIALSFDGAWSSGPAVFASLSLVLTGVAFVTYKRTTASVGFACGMAFMGSLQISQTMERLDLGQTVDSTSLNNVLQVIAVIVSITGGFVLGNAIQRREQTIQACADTYDTIVEELGPADVPAAIDSVDGLLLDRAGPGGPTPLPQVRGTAVRRAFGRLQVILDDRVSAHEWLVLLLGSLALLLALQVIGAPGGGGLLFTLRAMGAAVVVGLLFTIRDYDRLRPRRLPGALQHLHEVYEVPHLPNGRLDSIDANPESNRNVHRALVVLVVLVAIFSAIVGA